MTLSKFITKYIFIIVGLCALLAFLFTILLHYNSFNKEISNLKKEFINYKKEQIKREVERVYQFIQYKDDNSKEPLHKIQNELLDWISTIRFDKNGYIFINTSNKQTLIYDGKRLNPPIAHPNEKLFNKVTNTLKNQNNFFEYEFKKLNNEKLFKKVGYVKKFDKWGWIIGSGFYVDEIDEEINKKDEYLKSTIINELKSASIIFIILIISLILFSRKITKYINNNMKNLTYAFKEASIKNEKINTKNLTYKEFIHLADNINNILKHKNITEKKLHEYLEIINDYVIISTTDLKGNIIDASKAFCDISGYTKDELIGENHNIVRHEDMPKEKYKELWKKLKNGEVWRGEFKNKKKSGETYWVESVIHPTIQDDKIIGYTAIRHDITNKKKVEKLSITDELTQLYNRRFFNKVIEDELNRAKRENNYISFMMLDIDYFKNYNDYYGHQKGDNALVKVSELLKKSSKRVSDFVFRMGGEEFAFIFSSNNEEKSYEFARNIKESIENLKIEHKPSKISEHLTVSIGIVCKKAHEVSDSIELYKYADFALYKVKKNGRNSIYIKT